MSNQKNQRLNTVIKTENLVLRNYLPEGGANTILTPKTKNYLPKTHLSLKTKDSQLKTFKRDESRELGVERMPITKTKNQKLKTPGFTLVELIVVIVILAILATIAFLSFSSQSGSARDSVRLSDTTNIRKGLELRQAVAGVLPMPTSIAKTSTGGSSATGISVMAITEGVINNSVLKELSNGIKDPSGAEYKYSTISQGSSQPLYYQLALELENPTSLKRDNFNPFAESAFAAATDTSKIAQLKGNYSFDPNLPSLFVLSGSTTAASGGIYNPNICFVLDKSSTNTFSNKDNCIPKNLMSSKDYDSSLVGYWDMETLCSSNNCGVGNNGRVKDLSGNGNYLIATGALLPVAVRGSQNGAYQFQGTGTGSVPLNWGMFYTSGSVNYGGSQEMTAEVILNTIETCPQDSSIDGPNYSQIILESSPNMNSNTGAYGLSDWDYSNSDFRGCRSSASVHINTLTGVNNYFIARAVNRSVSNSWKIMTIRSSYSVKTGMKETSFFINGIKQESTEQYIYKSTITEAFRDYPIFIGARSGGTWSSNGIIDDVKIFNRALSDQDIRQHAKSAGF